MNDHLYPTDIPSLAPCSYVTVEASNPLPTGAWDEETVGSYAFPEWQDHHEYPIKSKRVRGEDSTCYTADTDDETIIDTTLHGAPRELVIIRRHYNSSGSLASTTSTAAGGAMTSTAPALRSFLRDRVHTFSSNVRVLGTMNQNLVGPPTDTVVEEGEEHGQPQVAANPVARFLHARVHTFASNVEVMSTVLAEQLEACLLVEEERDDEDDDMEL